MCSSDLRDLFELDDKQRMTKRVRDVMRPIRVVPESKHVNDLLNEIREEGSHMAVVVDEYGSTAGIVTLEDLVEEIVGEIHDEHEPERDFTEESPGHYLVAGSFDVGRLEELTGIHLEADTESTTVGGLVAEWLERLPAVGDCTERDGVTLEVVAVSGRRVEQVRVSKAKEMNEAGE